MSISPGFSETSENVVTSLHGRRPLMDVPTLGTGYKRPENDAFPRPHAHPPVDTRHKDFISELNFSDHHPAGLVHSPSFLESQPKFNANRPVDYIDRPYPRYMPGPSSEPARLGGYVGMPSVEYIDQPYPRYIGGPLSEPINIRRNHYPSFIRPFQDYSAPPVIVVSEAGDVNGRPRSRHFYYGPNGELLPGPNQWDYRNHTSSTYHNYAPSGYYPRHNPHSWTPAPTQVAPPENFTVECVLNYGNVTSVDVKTTSGSFRELPEFIVKELRTTYPHFGRTNVKVSAVNGEYTIWATPDPNTRTDLPDTKNKRTK